MTSDIFKNGSVPYKDTAVCSLCAHTGKPTETTVHKARCCFSNVHTTEKVNLLFPGRRCRLGGRGSVSGFLSVCACTGVCGIRG